MTVRYNLDAKESRFTAQAFASGVLSRLGHNPTFAVRDFSGEAQFAPDDLKSSSLRITIRTDSIELTDDVSSKDRQEIERQMRQDVLETPKYPDIVFESTDITGDKLMEGQYRVKIVGDVSLRGVTKKEQIDAQIRVYGDVLRTTGGFTLRQSAYGIRPVSALGGGIKLKDEIQFSFDIVARKEG